jgi:hypothetical protein
MTASRIQALKRLGFGGEAVILRLGRPFERTADYHQIQALQCSTRVGKT